MSETLPCLSDILKNSRGPNDLNLFEHLATLIEKMMLDHHHKDNFENFEKLSAFLKTTIFNYKAPRNEYEINNATLPTGDLDEYWKACLEQLGV
jgi:hypothetical protein